MGVMKSVERWGWLAAWVGAAAQVACAAAPKAEMQPGAPGAPVEAAPATSLAPEEPAPQTLAEAEASLEKARAELERLALDEPSRAATGAATPAPAPAAESRRAEEGADGRASTAKADTQCDAACRAYSSLNRASDAVCRLDAEGGKRCERARQIRDNASQRVASCACVK